MNSDGLIDRILEIIGGQSARNFAKLAGVNDGTLRSILKGSRPSIDIVIQIAKAGNVNIDWLATGNGPKDTSDAAIGRVGDYIGIPRVSAHLSAGNGHWNEQSIEILDHIPFTQEFLNRKLGRVTPDGLIILEADGDSMSPTIADGDLIMVDQKVERITDGIYAFLLNDMALIKRLRRSVSGDIDVISDNPHYENERLNADEFQQFSLIGKVVWSGHHFSR